MSLLFMWSINLLVEEGKILRHLNCMFWHQENKNTLQMFNSQNFMLEMLEFCGFKVLCFKKRYITYDINNNNLHFRQKPNRFTWKVLLYQTKFYCIEYVFARHLFSSGCVAILTACFLVQIHLQSALYKICPDI